MRLLTLGLFCATFLAAVGCGQKLNPGGEGEAQGGGNTPTTQDPNVGTSGCGTAQVTYANGASALIASKCGTCHFNGYAPELGTYAKAKSGFGAGGGSNSVDNGSMPQNGKLTAQEKCVFTNWKAGGYAQ